MQSEKAQKVYANEGIEIFKLPFEKFKTNSISVYFHDELNSQNVAKNALVPSVLRHGCESYPTRKEISIKLQELYGAVFDCGISKKGERQIIHFYMETIKDSFTTNGENLWEMAFEVLFEIMTKPVLKDQGFVQEYVDIEKLNIKKLIEGRMNDKASYATDRCIEEMCKNEPYGIFEYGDIKDYNNISTKDLYVHYKEMLSSCPVSIYLTGQIDDKMIELVKNSFAKLVRKSIKKITPTGFGPAPSTVSYIEDKFNVNQGKLCMGFRTNVDPASPLYYKLLVYNSILGGGIHSKLFQNVREKEGLAYYAHSRLERFKGLMILSSGIEISNKDKVINIMNLQLEEMKNGNINDYEFDSAKKSIENQINSMKDSQISLTEFNIGQNILDTDETLDSVIQKVNAVTISDVVEISKVVIPDTVYFLTGI